MFTTTQETGILSYFSGRKLRIKVKHLSDHTLVMTEAKVKFGPSSGCLCFGRGEESPIDAFNCQIKIVENITDIFNRYDYFSRNGHC